MAQGTPTLPPVCSSHITLLSAFSFWLCHVACGILDPGRGTEPLPPAVDAQSLPLGCQEVLLLVFGSTVGSVLPQGLHTGSSSYKTTPSALLFLPPLYNSFLATFHISDQNITASDMHLRTPPLTMQKRSDSLINALIESIACLLQFINTHFFVWALDYRATCLQPMDSWRHRLHQPWTITVSNA